MMTVRRVRSWEDVDRIYLPILRISPQHQRIFSLTDISSVIFLNLFDILIGLDALVLGKGSLVPFLCISSAPKTPQLALHRGRHRTDGDDANIPFAHEQGNAVPQALDSVDWDSKASQSL